MVKFVDVKKDWLLNIDLIREVFRTPAGHFRVVWGKGEEQMLLREEGEKLMEAVKKMGEG